MIWRYSYTSHVEVVVVICANGERQPVWSGVKAPGQVDTSRKLKLKMFGDFLEVCIVVCMGNFPGAM